MKKTKILLLSSIIATSVPVFIASCSKNSELDKQEVVKVHNYDFGLATDPINNLNYVKYKSVDRILPSLVDGFIKTGPNDGLKQVLPHSKYTMVMMEPGIGQEDAKFDTYFNNNKAKFNAENTNGYGGISGSFYQLDNFGFTGGLGAPSQDNIQETAIVYAYRNPKNPNNYMAFTGMLNKGLNKWSNGDVVTGQDMQDYLHYILDLNTGSQKLDTLIKFGFRSVNKFIDAQKEYVRKYNKNYKNPFGKRGFIFNKEENRYVQNHDELIWQSQTGDADGNAIDKVEVEAIKKAALELGFYTGQLFHDYSNKDIAEWKKLPENKNFKLDAAVQDFWIPVANAEPRKIRLIKNEYANPYQKFNDELVGEYKALSSDEYSFTVIFDENNTPGLVFLLTHVMFEIFPINRKFVETEAGGIANYGSKANLFLTTGPYDLAEVELGPQGYIMLKKNDNYYTAENTLSKLIKIYFSTDKVINATLFEDGYISQAFIPANKMNSYWTNAEYKNFLNKNSGYGTIAFGFNLDNETNANSYIQDQDLRNAIYHAVDRESILKSVGWDFSFPVNTWTAFGQYKTSDGVSLELFLDGKKVKAKDGTEFDLQNYSQYVHLAKSYNFEKTHRTDLTFAPKTAQFYLERFKAKHPDLKKVTIKYLNNSTDEHKKAGQYLADALNKAFGGFVELDVKSLPENTYASFIEEGKYDIIYQNYDKLGGNGVHDYVAAFFEPDEIDSMIQKSIGFKYNPSGSFTFANYVSDLVSEATKNTAKNVIEPLINVDKNIPDIDAALKDLREHYTGFNKENFVKKYSSLYAQEFAKVKAKFPNLANKEKELFTEEFYTYIFEALIATKDNIYQGRIKKLYNIYLINVLGLDKITELTKDTMKRLNIPAIFWKKFVQLAYKQSKENISAYSSRIDALFSGNFSKEELAENWNEAKIFEFVAELEKIVRDASPVIPLMEVDTNWEITKIGGVNSLYTFSLQYAYDFTRPPRPGLPRKREG
ncbi:ABC transporter substrate-binding protein [Mycoplasmopsis alligatoris]|uniref:Bacterial extracellular solute-binding protein, family 5 n=1 Tax=Mycoplasmopsis alligatoris A21JP2 TaxID=747682 RepID=D4XVZ9_9BACT|nr:ABC transporter substrate-binding protein [Mycoplasmopsis alligatoris]EFF41462.1 bacterial extracellular solute-binding protein, family 5 [Mycoplasmopsis alligatoris A21JP2]